MLIPIGKERVEFNAFRMFYPSTIIESFDKMELLEISVCDNGEYKENIDIHKYDIDVVKSRYGQIFGLFMFRRIKE